MSAQKGYHVAQYWLGVLLVIQGVLFPYLLSKQLNHLNKKEEAIKWFKQAASNGSEEARRKLEELGIKPFDLLLMHTFKVSIG